MDIEKVNRLPVPTYRYLKTNDSALPFRKPERPASAVFSREGAVSLEKGISVPAGFTGASAAWKEAALSGETCTVRVPEGGQASLVISVCCGSGQPDYAGAFAFVLEKGASLHLVWKWTGAAEPGVIAAAAFYTVGEGASLSVSHLEIGMEERVLCFQRYTETEARGRADFASADMGGHTVIVNSRGILRGKESGMQESEVYAAGGSQALDFFYHIDHLGEDTESDIEVKGALSGEAKKIFRGTIDFKRGCAGAVGSEGDYAIQLDKATKNISLPLLLCTEDNVQGNHASSAGQIDAGTVYYLMTRGFTYEEARRIVVESLIRPLIDRMDESLREDVLASVREKLDTEE